MNVVALAERRVARHLELEEKARSAFIAREFERALVGAREAVRFGPRCYQAQVLLGDVCCAVEREAEALRAYHRAKRLAPRRAEAWWSISTVHFLTGRWKHALKYLEAAELHLARGDGPLYEWIAEDRAIAMHQLGLRDESLRVLRQSIKRRPKSARLRELLAELKAPAAPRLKLVSAPGGKVFVLRSPSDKST